MVNLSKYKVIFYFVKPYWIRYVCILVMGMVLAVIECFNLGLFLPIFQSFLGSDLQQNQAKGFLKLIQRLIDMFPVDNKIIAACCILVISAVLKFVLSSFNQYFISVTSGKVMVELKERILNKYSIAKYQYFLDTKQGHLVYVALTSPDKVALVLFRIPVLLNNFIILIGVLFLLFAVNVYATFVLLSVGVLVYILITLISRTKVYHFGRKMAQGSGELNSLIAEFITGVKQIYVYNAAKKWLERHKKINDQYSHLYVLNNVFAGLPKDLLEFTLIPLVAISATVFIVNNPKEFASFLPIIGVFIMGVLRIIPYISTMSATHMLMTGNLNDCELVFNELHKKNEREETGKVKFASLKNSIVFDSVSFFYEGRDILLKDCSIRFEKKHISAIVGKSGSGKSTIVNMILGLYRPSQGKILIDGIDLYQYDLKSWLAKIGFISQDAFVFHATIAENIAFGSEYSMDDIIESARVANAHNFISEFSQGYNTVVGERGMKLSGGQLQRIAIARAVIRKPEILILDEATSALDNESESLIQASINTISKSTTTIIIAHRLSTVQNADKILFLTDGRVEEEGRHAELMTHKGHYWKLYTSYVDS